MSQEPIILYGMEQSGHSHRVETLLRMLDLPYVLEHSPAQVRQTEAFKKINPLGQIPVIRDGDVTVCDSNAIMVYLVKRYGAATQWLPEDPVTAANVQRWLSIAAGELKYGPAAARIVAHWNGTSDVKEAVKITLRVLAFMEQHLENLTFLAADYATLADLACYAYIAHAPEGGVALEPYPSVCAWIKRVQALPKFKLMPPLPQPAMLA